MPAVYLGAYTVRSLQIFCAPAKAVAARWLVCASRCGAGKFAALAATAFILIASNTAAFAQFAPTIAAISPNSGGQYAQVTISGNNFAGTTAVYFGSTPATTATVSTGGFPFDTISATVPAGTGTVNVTVVTPVGTSNAVTFTYTPRQKPPFLRIPVRPAAERQ
jgi:hypothetical protein